MSPSNGTNVILTERAPNLALPLQFFLTALTALVALLVISIWKSGLLALDYVHNSATLAVTHLFTLGFGGLVLSGAMYQLTPVVLHSRSPKPAWVNLHLALQTLGLVLMVIGFLQYQTWFLIVGGSLVVASGILFAINLLPVFRQAENLNWHGYFLFMAVLFYLSTLGWGLVMSLNMRYGFIAAVEGAPLAAHLALGVGGWFSLAIIGVGTKLVPLFAPSKPLPSKFVAVTGLSLVLGVMTFLIGLFTWRFILWGGALMMTAALLSYTGGVLYTIHIRRGKAMDFSLVFAATGALLSSAVSVTALAGLAGLWDSLYLQAGLLCLYMLGWIGGTILGMLLRILPFVVWLHRSRTRLTIDERIPFIHQMFHPSLGWTVYLSWFSGAVLISAGFVWSNEIAIATGAVVCLFGLFALGWAVSQVLRHVRRGSPALFPNRGHKS